MSDQHRFAAVDCRLAITSAQSLHRDHDVPLTLVLCVVTIVSTKLSPSPSPSPPSPSSLSSRTCSISANRLVSSSPKFRDRVPGTDGPVVCLVWPPFATAERASSNSYRILSIVSFNCKFSCFCVSRNDSAWRAEASSVSTRLTADSSAWISRLDYMSIELQIPKRLSPTLSSSAS